MDRTTAAAVGIVCGTVVSWALDRAASSLSARQGDTRPTQSVADSHLTADRDTARHQLVHSEQDLQRLALGELSVQLNCSAISWSSLAELTRVPNITIRKRAWKLLLDVAASDDFVYDWVRISQLDDEDPAKHQVVMLLANMSQYDYLCDRLIDVGAVRHLVQALWSFRANMKTYQHAIMTLRRVSEHRGKMGKKLVKYGALEGIKTFLITVGAHFLPAVTQTLELVQQLSTNDYVSKKMTLAGYISLLAGVCTSFKGNFGVQKLCITTVVRALTVLDQKEAVKHLTVLEDSGFVDTLDYCVHTNNNGLVYWTIGLVHEFVVKGVARDKIVAIKGFPKILVSYLGTMDENFIVRIVLRTMKLLSQQDATFMTKLTKAGLLAQVMKSLDQPDNDTQYWLIQVLHDIAQQDISAPFFLEKDYLQRVMQLFPKVHFPLNLFVCDTLVYLSAAEKLRRRMVENGIANIIFTLLSESEEDPRMAGITVLFNLLCFSQEPRFQRVYSLDFIQLLAYLMTSRESALIRSMCAKCLLTLAQADNAKHCALIHDNAFKPLLATLAEFIQSHTGKDVDKAEQIVEGEASDSKHLISLLDCTRIFLERKLFRDLCVENAELIETVCTLLDEVADVTDRKNKFLDIDFGEEEEKAMSSTIRLLGLCLPQYKGQQKFASVLCHHITESSVHFDAAVLALLCMPLVHYKQMQFTEQQHEMLIYSLTLRLLTNPLHYLSSHLLSKLLFRDNDADFELIDDNKRLSGADCSDNLHLSPNGLEAFNDSWTFESARCTQGFSDSPTGKYMFEVEVLTSNIVQIGLSHRDNQFDAEGGAGVGDDEWSYSIDGYRVKKWHRAHSGPNNYGRAWVPGDVIGCCIDTDSGCMSYYINGEPLGTAFKNVAKEARFPAVSLSTGQACRCIFDHFIFPIDGYSTPSSAVSTHHFARYSASDEVECDDDANVLKPLMYYEVLYTHFPGFQRTQFIGLTSHNAAHVLRLAENKVEMQTIIISRKELLPHANGRPVDCKVVESTVLDMNITNGALFGFGLCTGGKVQFFLNSGKLLGSLDVATADHLIPVAVNVPRLTFNAGQFGFATAVDRRSIVDYLATI